MDQIKDLLVDYHTKLNDFVSSGVIPGDSFFELEDEILQYYDLVPPDTYYFQSALQLKMAKIKSSDADSILKELSDFMIPLRNKIGGEVFICDPILVEISSVNKGMYDLLIEYYELVCGEDENCVYARKPAMLHFNESSPLRTLLATYGYDADAVLAELDAVQQTHTGENADSIHLDTIRRDYDSVSKCMITATIDTFFGREENVVPSYDVIEAGSEYSRLEKSLQELYRIFDGEEFLPAGLRRLKTHVLEKDPFGQYEAAFYMILFAIKDALGGIQSDMIHSCYFYRLIHQYLLKHRFRMVPETANYLVEKTLRYAMQE